MYTVAIISQKGGAGKSTLARHGAVLCPASALIDLDAQGTTARWLERRADLEHVADVYEIPARADQLPAARDRAERAGIEWLIIDTPPAHDDERAVRAALEIADLALVPVQPSPDDLDAIGQTLQNAQAANRPFAFVVNRAKPNTRMTKQAGQLLASYGTVAPIPLRDLVAYPEATIDGEAVTEHAPSSSAAADMSTLWEWVRSHAAEVARHHATT